MPARRPAAGPGVVTGVIGEINFSNLPVRADLTDTAGADEPPPPHTHPTRPDVRGFIIVPEDEETTSRVLRANGDTSVPEFSMTTILPYVRGTRSANRAHRYVYVRDDLPKRVPIRRTARNEQILLFFFFF